MQVCFQKLFPNRGFGLAVMGITTQVYFGLIYYPTRHIGRTCIQPGIIFHKMAHIYVFDLKPNKYFWLVVAAFSFSKKFKRKGKNVLTHANVLFICEDEASYSQIKLMHSYKNRFKKLIVLFQIKKKKKVLIVLLFVHTFFI